MLMQIGAKLEGGFDQPMEMLTDCHKRIRQFLKALVATAQNSPKEPLDQPNQDRLRTALRYFRVSGPKHTADEEESLFPRMRRMDSPEVQRALDVVSRIEEDHRYAEAKHEQVVKIFTDWVEKGSIPQDDHARLNTILSELTSHYDQHIDIEEKQVFPAAASALSSSEEESIGKEMAARRGVPFRAKIPAKPWETAVKGA